MPTRRDPERDPDEIDEDLDLPPPDDDDGALPEGETAEDLLGGLDDVGGLDDATAGDLDVGEDDLDEDEAKADTGDEETDVGALDEGMLVDEDRTTGADPDGLGDDESDIAGDLPGEDDGGAEGTSEDPGDEVDEAAFPDLDDDASGTGDEDALADELLAESEPALPWASSARWAPLEGAGALLPCRAVAAASGRVAAAGEVLILIEDGARAARSLPFGEGSVAVALGDDALLAATLRGQLLLTHGSGAGAVSLGSWRAGVGSSLGLWPAESGAPAVELCATPGRFWIRAGAALLCFRSVQPMLDRAASPEPPAPVRDRGVLAITASRGVLLALASGPEGPVLERFRSDDEGWAATPLTEEARNIAERDRGALRFAAAGGGRTVALSDQQRVAVSRDGGATFKVMDLGWVPAIAFAGDEADAALLLLSAPKTGDGAEAAPTGSARVLELRDEGVSQIGEIASPGDDGGAGGEGPKSREASPWATAALAWDASREVVWIACAAGLLALGRPQRH